MGKNYGLAWSMVIWPGLLSPIGGAVGFLFPPDKLESISLSLGFAGGVLIWVALVGIHPESLESFTAGIENNYQEHFEDKYAWLPRFSLLMSMIAGLICAILIDYLAHKIGNPHHHPEHPTTITNDKVNENENENEKEEEENNNINLDINSTSENNTEMHEVSNGKIPVRNTSSVNLTTSKENNLSESQKPMETILTKEQYNQLTAASFKNFIAVTLHNLPEGLATFTATIADPKLGVLVAVAFALHEFPLGISVGAPLYFSTGSKIKTLLWTTLCGFSDMFGGAIAHIILATSNDLHDNTNGFIFGFVAGLMIWVALKELIPQARMYDKLDKYTTILIFVGFLFMDVVFIVFDGTGGHSHGDSGDDGHNHRRRRRRNLLKNLL